jgi:acyl carrier protein
MSFPPSAGRIRDCLEAQKLVPAGTSFTEELLDSGILKSLEVIRVVVLLEREFGVRIEQDEIVPENFSSAEAMAALLSRKQGPPDRPKAQS